jgi:hypothetical protein
VHRHGKPAEEGWARDWVSIIIAIGLASAVNCITIAVLFDAVRSSQPGLSENATQVLTGAFGGMIGILGAQLGYRAGLKAGNGSSVSVSMDPVPQPQTPSIEETQEMPKYHPQGGDTLG